jgi:hypothetical protein
MARMARTAHRVKTASDANHRDVRDVTPFAIIATSTITPGIT